MLSVIIIKVNVNEILIGRQKKCAAMGLDTDGNLHVLLLADGHVLLASDTYEIEYKVRKILEVDVETGLKNQKIEIKYVSRSCYDRYKLRSKNME